MEGASRTKIRGRVVHRLWVQIEILQRDIGVIETASIECTCLRLAGRTDRLLKCDSIGKDGESLLTVFARDHQ